MFRFFLFIITLLLWSVPCQSKDIPENAMFFPNQPSFGVNCHTHGNGKELKAVGAKWVRLDFSWAGIETGKRGNYVFTDFDKVVDGYHGNGLNILGLLAWHSYCDVLYPKPESEADFDAGVEGYANFAAACAGHYRGKVQIWELGNEPECFPLGNINRPERYTKLARAAAKAIRKVDPNVRVGALSVAWMDRAFIQRCLELGLLADGAIDVITYHGYHRANLLPESGLRDDITWLRNQIRKYAPKGKQVIVVDSERGYCLTDFLKPKSWDSWRNVLYSETEQAAYLARHFLEEISLGIEVSIWYKDMSGESGYSLYEGGPGSRIRPMGYAMRNLSRLFDTNPRQMVNDKFPVTLVDLPNKTGDPNSFLKVRSYLKDKRLIITAWNPVEAFDGKILDTRRRIGDNYYEAWRAISPEDKVDIEVQVTIDRLNKDRVAKSYTVNLLEPDEAKKVKTVKLEGKGETTRTENLKIGPIPTVLVVELK